MRKQMSWADTAINHAEVISIFSGKTSHHEMHMDKHLKLVFCLSCILCFVFVFCVCASLVFAFCVCASLVPRFHPFSPHRSYNPAAFSAANPIKRKKLVRRWVLLYWVSKPERSGAIKTTLLSLLLIIPSSETQHIGILLSTTLLTHLSGPTENMVSSVEINICTQNDFLES